MTVSTVVELPEVLDSALTKYLEDHPAWDRERLWQAMASLFLLQNGEKDPKVNSAYLDSLFGYQT